MSPVNHQFTHFSARCSIQWTVCWTKRLGGSEISNSVKSWSTGDRHNLIPVILCRYQLSLSHCSMKNIGPPMLLRKKDKWWKFVLSRVKWGILIDNIEVIYKYAGLYEEYVKFFGASPDILSGQSFAGHFGYSPDIYKIEISGQILADQGHT